MSDARHQLFLNIFTAIINSFKTQAGYVKCRPCTLYLSTYKG
jgi:hypothetical protein